MKAELAASLFRGVEKYNCAQAVLKAYQVESGLSEADLKAASNAGNGKAPGGRCGALQAAMILLDTQEVVENVRQEFASAAGSTKCKEVRSINRLKCRECVALAAGLIERHMDRFKPDDPAFVAELRLREAELLSEKTAGAHH
ncbi:C-GCAxxG-C-C family (seleno)protein [Pseudodesulfovibrio sp.]|uniref:C-GCAxxG-C-C family (seleno)protein n=1 Tax=unclassified Pseudodesulfovibrio TaxID=2661612 RepID=UPI003AFFBE7C